MPVKNSAESPGTITYEELVVYGDEIAGKKEEVKKLGDELNRYVDGISDKTREAIELKVGEFESGQISGDILLSEYPDKDSPEHKALRIYLTAHDIYKNIQELEELHKPRKAYELATLAESISSRFDWEAFVQHYEKRDLSQEDDWDNGHISNGVASVLRLHQATNKASQGVLAEEDYQTLEYWQNQIEDQSKEWEKRGFLKEIPESEKGTFPTKEELTKERLDMKDRLEYAQEVLERYGDLRNRYRGLNQEYSFRDKTLNQIITVLDLENRGMNMSEEWIEYEYDPRMLKALEGLIARKRQEYINSDMLPTVGPEYIQFLEKARSVELENVINNIKIEGLEQKPNEELLLTEEGLRELIGQNIPAFFLDKIELVIMKERPKELDTDDINTETIGVHLPEFDDKGNLIKSRIEIYATASVPEGTDSITKALAKGELEGTILHEIAHRIHHELTYDEMQEWEKVVENDTTDVTWYVEHMRKKSKIRGNREDFCDTYKTAIQDPGYLYTLSKDRFNYMIGLITRYMGDSQRNVFIQEGERKINSYITGIQEVSRLIAERKANGETE